MKVYLLPFLFVLFACQNKIEKQTGINENIKKNSFNHISLEKDYEEILLAILTYDSSYHELMKTNKPQAFINNQFIKISIDTLNDELPPSPNGVTINELLTVIGNTALDSIGYFNQTNNLNTVFVPKEIATVYKVLDGNKLKMPEYYFSRYDFHIPILSHNGKKAFVSLDYNCGPLCGGGSNFILNKIKDKWIVVKRNATWIS
ncbi:hypothetical protein ABE545_16255 [Sphingobacterium faecium]|uniref:hypothetical protein n=1 Tax=Sphingobacterium faecium TaxID=34087 RepID=UPI003207D920